MKKSSRELALRNDFMISIKTKEEIELMRQGGAILSGAVRACEALVRPGISLRELDTCAREYIVGHSGEPAFFGYGQRKGQPGYPATLCASVNDEVVHGIGCRDIELKEGDVVGLDLGVKYRGMYTDMAVTVGAGSISAVDQRLITVTREALQRSISKIAPGVKTSVLSKTIQQWCEGNGFGVIRDLSGHGIGHNLHEEPAIYCFYDSRHQDVVLKEGMVICIEPMVTVGDWSVTTDKDCWTIRTKDGSRAAHFEHTIAVTKDGYEILTEWKE